MNNCKTQSVGQKLVDPSEKLRRESADRTKEQTKSDNAVPKVATSKAASLSEKSRWEAGTEGSDPLNNRHFGSQLIHEHGKNSGSESLLRPSSKRAASNTILASGRAGDG